MFKIRSVLLILVLIRYLKCDNKENFIQKEVLQTRHGNVVKRNSIFDIQSGFIYPVVTSEKQSELNGNKRYINSEHVLRKRSTENDNESLLNYFRDEENDNSGKGTTISNTISESSSKQDSNLPPTNKISTVIKDIKQTLNQWTEKEESGDSENDHNSYSNDLILKRNPFNPWGGKRSSPNAWAKKRAEFNPWAGKRSSFSPWAGKRASDSLSTGNRAFNPWASKRDKSKERRAFNPWAGKRAPFKPWGKRASLNPWGKRASFNPWGKRATSNPWGKRAPFNPWGKRAPFNPWGKRSYINLEEKLADLADKRAKFNPWAGKRSALNPWTEKSTVKTYSFGNASGNKDIAKSKKSTEEKSPSYKSPRELVNYIDMLLSNWLLRWDDMKNNIQSYNNLKYSRPADNNPLAGKREMHTILRRSARSEPFVQTDINEKNSFNNAFQPKIKGRKKRETALLNELGSKKDAFVKRSPFSPWGGKRSTGNSLETLLSHLVNYARDKIRYFDQKTMANNFSSKSAKHVKEKNPKGQVIQIRGFSPWAGKRNGQTISLRGDNGLSSDDTVNSISPFRFGDTGSGELIVSKPKQNVIQFLESFLMSPKKTKFLCLVFELCNDFDSILDGNQSGQFLKNGGNIWNDKELEHYINLLDSSDNFLSQSRQYLDNFPDSINGNVHAIQTRQFGSWGGR